eukprot:Clim_evm31s136 gene=Clim_evmTU31s136
MALEGIEVALMASTSAPAPIASSVGTGVLSSALIPGWLLQASADLTAGTAGGVRMQTAEGANKPTMVNVARDIVRSDRLWGLYKGAVPAIAANVAENATLFMFYKNFQQLVLSGLRIKGDTRESVEELNALENAVAGAIASVCTSVILTPCELIKCRMQTSNASASAVVREVVAAHGMPGLFRGLTSTWAREIPGGFAMFGAYEGARGILARDGDKENLGAMRTIVAGGLGGCAFWSLTYPIDLVKSRIQTHPGKIGIVTMTSNIVRQGGWAALYAGVVPTLIRSFPANGALFVTYESVRKVLGGSD